MHSRFATLRRKVKTGRPRFENRSLVAVAVGAAPSVTMGSQSELGAHMGVANVTPQALAHQSPENQMTEAVSQNFVHDFSQYQEFGQTLGLPMLYGIEGVPYMALSVVLGFLGVIVFFTVILIKAQDEEVFSKSGLGERHPHGGGERYAAGSKK